MLNYLLKNDQIKLNYLLKFTRNSDYFLLIFDLIHKLEMRSMHKILTWIDVDGCDRWIIVD